MILAHARATPGFPFASTLGWVSSLGTLGVRIFFVISGFLITFLLLREERLRGAVSLSRFYLRRVLRIIPACYAYIIIAIVVGAISGGIPPIPDLLSALTYTMNYDRDRVWVLGHMWSLGVEEQFYLLWPLAFVLAPHRRRVAILLALLVLAPMARVLVWRFLPSWSLMTGETFPTIMDALATGVLLAVVREELHRWARYRELLRSWLPASLPLAILAVHELSIHLVLAGWLLGETVLNALIAVWLDWAVTREGTRTAALLNSGLMVVVGRLSYSLYLWQQPFMDRTGTGLLTRFPINVLAAGIMALASYRLVERPFLRLKDRLGRSVGRHLSGELTS